MQNRITSLKPNEVFIFGSNSAGFHGAGAAGFACRGDSQNNWRNDEWFLKAIKSLIGSPDRVGKWAIVGQSRGFQIGREGMSYAIETIKNPGQKRSTSLTEIYKQFLDLLDSVWYNRNLSFLMTPVGTNMAGYTNKEMRKTWSDALRSDLRSGQMSNLIIPEDLYL